MKDYLSIGKVSKLKGVSIKSLRYYDEIGILKPAYVNSETNYRYYKPEQLFLIDAITLCIELGIPLKTLPSYKDEEDNWDFQRLLFDGKALAEDKIKAMRNSIDALQTTLRKIDSGEITTKLPEPVSEPERKLPVNTYKATLDTRYILAVPFDVSTSPEHYNHKLLELFVGANKNGLNTAYPAGLYYESIDGVCSRYVFVYLTDQNPSLSDDTSFMIRSLPAGDYLCSQKSFHQIERAKQVFSPFFEDKGDYQLLEQSVKASDSKDTYFELQYPFQS